MRIIPAIDIIDGKCVRLSQGDYSRKTIYNESPLKVAKSFEDNGLKYLHLVDLDGAKANKIINWKVLYEIASQTNLIIDFGGGIKSEKSADIAFENGAKQITAGSIAVKEPEEFISWVNKYGPDSVILGADANKEKIAVNGWKESTSLDLLPYVSEYVQKGVQYVTCTDITQDGMLNGPSINLYEKMMKNISGIKLIASGGVSSLADLDDLKKLGIEGVIIGKAIYEGRFQLKELRKYVD